MKRIITLTLAVVMLVSTLSFNVVFAQEDFWVLEPTIEADDITFLGGDTFKIKVGDKFGLISSNGNIQLPIEFDSIEKCLCVDGVTEFVVSKANQLSHAIFKKQGEKFVFQIETGHGGGSEEFWDLNSNRIFSGEYELGVEENSVEPFMRSAYITEQKSEYGNYNGYDADWDRISEYYAYVKNNQVMTGFMFEEFKSFSQGVSAVKKDGKWGYMDNNANMTIWYQFDTADSFKYGIAPVSLNGESYFIDLQGNKVADSTFEQTRIFDDINGNAWVKKGGRWGIVSTQINERKLSVYEDAYIKFLENDIKNYKFDEIYDVELGEMRKVNFNDFYKAYVIGTKGGTDQALVCQYNYEVEIAGEASTIAIFRYENGAVVLADVFVGDGPHGYSLGIAEDGRFLIGEYEWFDAYGHRNKYYSYDNSEIYEKFYIRYIPDNVYENFSKDEIKKFESENLSFFMFDSGYIGAKKDGQVVTGRDNIQSILTHCENFVWLNRLEAKDEPLYNIFKLTDNLYRIENNKELEISVVYNGTKIVFDQPPIIENGRTLVPMRAIFEAMGAEVKWDENTRSVTATKGDIIVTIQIGNNIMTKNGTEITLDVPAKLINGRTLVPARAVAESFGATVDWDGTTSTVIINYDFSLIYKNEKSGYQLTLPNGWLGYYYIEEHDDGSIDFRYYGESEHSRDFYGQKGVPIFVILRESQLDGETLDSITKIGTVNSINYYYATGTSAVIGHLMSSEYADLDEKERLLIDKDLLKYQQMQSEIEVVLKTFKVIL